MLFKKFIVSFVVWRSGAVFKRGKRIWIGSPKKHIFDLEGDWFHLNAPEWMLQCIKSGSSTKKENYVQPFCIRPCFSYLLLYLGQHNPTYELEFPDDKSFCFCGLPDQRGVRGNMAQCINKMGVKNQMQFNQFWGAKRSIDSPEVTNYMDLLINNLISLCPRGMGADTVRFYETCFFGRVPVVISDMAIMGEDFYDTSFVFKINPYLSIEDMTTELMKVNDTPYTELVERAKLARQYFQNVLIPYFKDPTQYFFDFLKRHNL